jgi:hypothetical protein
MTTKQLLSLINVLELRQGQAPTIEQVLSHCGLMPEWLKTGTKKSIQNLAGWELIFIHGDKVAISHKGLSLLQ